MESQQGLKALLLVGGFGTRLRPFTLSKAKPLVEFVNKPIICHQIEALKKVGVSEIVLAINYQPERMYDFIKDAENKYQIKITCSKEDEPLNTGGPIGLAKKILQNTEGNEIFVFNSDVTCCFPLKEMLDFHRIHQKEGTIAVTKVKDPSKYGVILSDEKGKILNFVEKPQIFIGDNINAGLYIFNKKFLDRVEPKPISLEREIFPQMAKEEELYVFQLEGFWADIGQPKDYLIGTNLFLQDLENRDHIRLCKGSNILGNVLIDESVMLPDDCLIGPNVVIGKGVIIKSGTRIKNSVIFDYAIINNHSFIDGSIIGWRSKIGRWSRLENLTLLGEDVVISDEIVLDSTIVLPNVSVKSSNKGNTILC